jgi:regulator of replication initiation timing
MKTKGDGDRKIRTDAIPVYSQDEADLKKIQQAHPEIRYRSDIYKKGMREYVRNMHLYQELSDLKAQVAQLTKTNEDNYFIQRALHNKVDSLEKTIGQNTQKLDAMYQLLSQAPKGKEGITS